MPRVVDPEVRRAAVAAAVWRLVCREGLEAVSVRSVAQEAGLSTGALRHYFTDHLDVLTLAMRLVIDQAQKRVVPLLGRATPERIIEELLPLDAERVAEAEVWLAFTARAQHEPRLREIRDESYDLLESLFERLVHEISPGLTARMRAVEAERLYALVDGLVVHAVARPDRVDAVLLRAVVRRHVAELGGR